MPEPGKQNYAESNRKRIAILTAGDARNPQSWSGTPFFMGQALEKYIGETLYIGPLSASALPLLKIYGKMLRLIRGLDYSPYHATLIAKQFASSAAKKVIEARPDVVFAPAGSFFASRIPANVPLVYSSDASFRLVDGYHPHYRNLSASSRRDGEQLERSVIERADLNLYPSEWAARSAIEDYGADPEKVHVVPYGANLIDPPSRESVLQRRAARTCKLLFIGVNWKEKGAAIAVEALRHLRGTGIDAELTICGCIPPTPIEVEGLTVVPFLDKRNPAQFNRLKNYYMTSDFFILPTRADCYGVAFCEAAAYGLPSIGTLTGGVPSVVRDGENGHLLPIEATGRDYALLIAEMYRDPARYESMRYKSRDAFEQRLNWDNWGRMTAQLIEDLMLRWASSTQEKQLARRFAKP